MPFTQSRTRTRTRTRQYTIYPYSDPKPILLELLFPLLPFPHPLFLILLILLILLLLLLHHSPMTNEEKQQQQQQQPHHQPVNVTRIPLSQSLSLSLFSLVSCFSFPPTPPLPKTLTGPQVFPYRDYNFSFKLFSLFVRLVERGCVGGTS